ncbi:hypothetical protein C7C46_05105 [Streptomyces tateyamensis]|uniref:Lipoprotein n=1 Tax=Streptomyces tateyamensis TaxID=565073 RepID=A0A2V4NMK6_9ACTN|nr:hypothetical protein C7C46_05105 [Streptomyces tateyamensis]
MGAGRSAVLVAAVAAALTGCAGKPAGPSAPPVAPQPQTAQAQAVASQEFGLLAGGGWAPAWSLWPASAQQAISAADFVRLNTECKPQLGTAYVLDSSTKLDDTTVRVGWHRGAQSGSNTVAYQDGKWRFVPDASALADYRLGVDQLVERRRAAGDCH